VLLHVENHRRQLDCLWAGSKDEGNSLFQSGVFRIIVLLGPKL
jgi:hypothetical protein